MNPIDPRELERSETERHRIIDETTARGDSRIQQFYSGAVVLVTGGSGFLGKQLIEKLFRSCDIAKIYMLLRRKKGKSVDERLASFVKDPVFEKLYTIKPEFSKKISPVLGDITELGLGINEKDWTTLMNEVTVIIHGAATISFTEPLKLATLTNVRGTRETLLLGKACKKLKAFVHISTAYTHATHSRVKKPVLEKFYDSPISPKVLIQLAETVDEKILNDMTPELIKDWQNTYTFTKAVTEELIRNMGTHLPICIVRPAIVVAAYREPAPGWIEPSCIYGPMGFLFGLGLGVLHTIHVDLNNCLDFVAVDLVNNAVIASAKEVADRKNAGEEEIKIYTVTGCGNPIAFGEIRDIIKESGPPSPAAIWYPFELLVKHKLVFLTIHVVLHVIPAHIADFVLRLLGKRPKAVKLCNLLGTFTRVYEYYSFNDWLFGDENLRQLYFNMSPADRIIFECNSRHVDWNVYLMLWCIGIRRHVIKDGLKNTKQAVKKISWLAVANAIVLPTYLYILYKIVYGIVFVAYMIVLKTISMFGF